MAGTSRKFDVFGDIKISTYFNYYNKAVQYKGLKTRSIL